MGFHNSKPFVSMPILNESGLILPPAAVQVQANIEPPTDFMESEYPEIYQDIYPIITEAVEKLTALGYTPTPEMINSMVDAIIKNSGMWYEDDDEDETMADVIPVQFGFNDNPYRRRRRRHHNRNSLRDIVRILLLRELSDRRGRRPYPGYY